MSSKLFRGTREVHSPPLVFRRAGAPAPSFPHAGRSPGLLPAQEAEMQTRIAEAETRAFAAGEAAGASATMKRATEQVTPVLASLAQIIEELSSLRARVRRDAEAGTVDLAMAVARRILHRELSIDSEAILGLVKSAVERLNARELHKLRVSPGDFAVIEAQRGRLHLAHSVQITPDASLPPGSAVFETARGEVDASVQTQLEEIHRGLADLVPRENVR